MKLPFASLKRALLPLAACAATAWSAQSATLALNFTDGWPAPMLAGETCDGFSNWTDSMANYNGGGPNPQFGTITLNGSSVTATWNSKNTWAAGSEANSQQQVYRVYLDDGEGGNSLVSGDGIGVSVTITGLGAWLAANGSQKYVVRCYASTDTGSASFRPVQIRQGAPNAADGVNQLLNLTVLETITMPVLGAGNFPTGTGGGGTRGYADSSVRTEDTITLTIATGASPTRGTLAGFKISTAEPSIAVQPQAPAGSVYLGNPFSLSVTASGLLPLSYQWYQGTQPINGATSNSYSVASATLADAGTYAVVITNPVGAVTSAPVTVSVVPGTPSVTQQPVGGTRFVGGYLRLVTSLAGSPPFQLQWTRDGNAVPGGTATTLLVTNLASGDAGTYVLWVTNSFGWTNSDGATLGLITAAAGSYEEMIVTNKPVGYWRLNEGAYAGDLPAVAYEYVGGNDAYHTNTSTADGIRPPAYLGMEDGNNAAYYAGSSASSTTASLMNNLSQFTLMGWFNPAIWPQQTPAPALNGRVALFGQNDAGEFGFHGQNIVGMWTPGGGYVSFDATTLISAGNWYFITAVGNGSNVTFYLNGNQAAQAWQTTTNYGSSSYPFRIGYGVLDAGANEFQGTIDEVVLFNKALSVETINSLYSKAVGVATPPTVLVQPAGGVRYVMQSHTFSVTAGGTLPLSYQWRHAGTNLPGATTNYLTLPNLTAAQSGTYDVIIANRAGTTNSDPVTLTVVTPAAGSYEESVIALNPVAYYRLNEIAGSTTTYDLWGGYNGTVDVGATLGGAGPVNPPFAGFEAGNTAVTTVNGTANSWVSCPAFNLNTNAVTLSAWVRADGSEGGWRGIVFSRAGNTIAGIHSGNGNELRYTWNNDGNTYGWDSGLQIPVGEWCFVAAVIEPAQATLYVGTATGLHSATHANTHAIEEFDGNTRIGNDAQDGTGRTWNGLVDEVMIVKRALSVSEVLGLYQKATAQEFKLVLSPGGLIEDSKPSGTPYPGQNLGVTWLASLADSAAVPPAVTRNGVAQFSAATGSQISTADTADLDSAYGTICFWMQATNVPLPTPGDEGAMLFDHRTTTGAVIVLHDDGTIFWQGQADSQNSFSAGYLPDGNWHHVAVTYGQSIGDTLAIYIDGTLASSVTVTNAWTWPAGQPLELGRSWDGYWKRFDGFLDDFRIYSRVLTVDEIASIKAGDALVDSAALKVRYDFGTAAGVGRTLTWPFGTLESSPTLGPSAIWTPVTGATPPTYTFPATESSLFFRAVY